MDNNSVIQTAPLWPLLLLPLMSAIISYSCQSAKSVLLSIRLGVLASAVFSITCIHAVHGGATIFDAAGWFYLDALSAFHLLVMMAVFMLSALYLPGYFHDDIESGEFTLAEARRFGALWFGALLAMTLVLVSNNIGIMWVGIEATTLVTAFLICIHRQPESVEAMWKYLIICSVGVAFAFMGTLLAGAAAHGIGLPAHEALLWTRLRQEALRLDPALLKVAFVFLIVGYGTKAGLAPMHSWLPDAHSQAPAPISALFSGFMLNAALYCVMRYMPLLEEASGHSGWSLRLMLFFGIFSVLAAAVFILLQKDIKRLLAYCSVEHLGIISIGLGLGGLGAFAALLHTLNHSVAKSLSFFAAGRVGQMYGTHNMTRMAGMTRTAPLWGKALFASLLALIGVAPFAVFLSEFLILRAAASAGAYWTMGLFLLGAAIVFIGALRHAMNMAWGEAIVTPPPERANRLDKAIVAGSLGALLVLGVWIPGLLREMIVNAATVLGAAL